MKRRSIIASIVFAVIATAGTAVAAPSGKLTVFAAASLKNALDEIAAGWRAESGIVVTISYAASSTLAKQIENGAPADLFISADTDWMDYLQQRNLLKSGSRVDLLGNALVLIAPKDSPVQATIAPGFPLAALLGVGKLAMGEPNSVPAGKYGKTALEKLGVWQSVAGRVAAAETVRAALALVARGEAPLGIVYATDAHAEPGVTIVGTFPANSHPPVTYPLALTATAKPDAKSLAEYLRSPAAAALFEAEGFTVLARER